MKVLFLDDDPERFNTLRKNHPEWSITWVQRVSAFLYCAREMHFDLIMLDHDLCYLEILWDEALQMYCGDPKEYTGYDAVVALVKEPGNALGTSVRIHSHNPCGASRMYRLLKEAGWDVTQHEF
jgi:hypothetical protein